jgi:hypothetical protein
MDDFSNRTGAVEKDAGQAWPRGGSPALDVQIPAEGPQDHAWSQRPLGGGASIISLIRDEAI